MIRHKRIVEPSAQRSLELPRTLASKNCTELSYRITMPSGKFKVEKFSEDIGGVSVAEGWNSVLLTSSNPQQDDYHVHVFWEPDSDDPSKTKLQVDYHAWPPETDASEKHHVAADNFFNWVGQYVDGASVNAHIHAEFEYPAQQWQSRIMALPIKVPFDDRTAVIDGFSISLPSAPQGVNQSWVVWDKKRLKFQMYADRVIHFKGFTPYDDVDALNAVVHKMVGERNL
jgi:hypothetical protein